MTRIVVYQPQVKEEIDLLYVELERINKFLLDYSGRKRNEQDMMKKVFVNQMKNVAHEAEDAIDTFILENAKRNRVSKFFCRFHYTTEIILGGIKSKIQEIHRDGDMNSIYRIENGRDGRQQLDIREFVEEDNVVGFVNEANTLLKQLIEGESQRDVISIVGMAGLGKTVLAKKIYNHTSVKNHFHCRVWVCVSQEYKIRDKLMEALPECLKDKRYLVVMDDVWEANLWDEVKTSLPDNLNGSRILITTRIKKVASYACSQSPPHFLRFLNPFESWELFSNKAFPGGSCPVELENIGKQIAEGCDGLPLSIVAMGRLMATKEKTGGTWAKVAGNVSLSLTTQCLDILALSYDNLPHELKPCFLYIGAFPGNFEIPVRQLITLWIAEGFIQKMGNRNMEDIAEDYLAELIDQSLIQVVRRRADEGIKTCRIHNLAREFCIVETARDNFIEVRENALFSFTSKPRRLSIQCSTLPYICSHPSNSLGVRSLLFFGQDAAGSFSTDHWKSLNKGFKLIKVLDLGSVVVDNVSTEIEKLIHLRYLRMNAPSLKTIPPSICSLRNLQTLDMRETCVSCLPNGIWKMQQLRHLYLFRPTSLPVPSLETENKALSNLQTLSAVADEDTTRLMVNAKFPNVTKLELRSSGKWNTRQFLESLNCLEHLQTLKIMESTRLPESLDSFPLSLTKLTLEETYLGYGQIKVLEKLPSLQILKLLRGSFLSPEIAFSAGGFAQLLVLQMVKLDASKWTMAKGAMQKLRRLIIYECVRLTELPVELWKVTTLQDVEVLQPSVTLAKSLPKFERKDGPSIRISPASSMS